MKFDTLQHLLLLPMIRSNEAKRKSLLGLWKKTDGVGRMVKKRKLGCRDGCFNHLLGTERWHGQEPNQSSQ